MRVHVIPTESCRVISAVLIITDDDPELRTVLDKTARAEGWDVVLCDSAEALLHALRASDIPALVILDIHMAQTDGIAAIEDIKHMERPLRLRFMTGGDVSHAVAARMIAQARDLKVGATLYKPFTLAFFREMVAEEMAALGLERS